MTDKKKQQEQLQIREALDHLYKDSISLANEQYGVQVDIMLRQADFSYGVLLAALNLPPRKEIERVTKDINFENHGTGF